MLCSLLILASAAPTQQTMQKIKIDGNPSVVFQRLSPQDNANGLIPDGIQQIIYDPTDRAIIVKGSGQAIVLLRSTLERMNGLAEILAVRLQHVSASYLFRQLFSEGASIAPEGTLVSVSNAQNALVVQGSKDLVTEAAQLIRQFDRPPRTVSLEMKAAVSALDRSFESSARLTNNTQWTFTDDSSGTKIQVIPRINADDSVTLIVSAGALGTLFESVERVKSGQFVYIRVFPRLAPGTPDSPVRLQSLISAKAVSDQEVKGFLQSTAPEGALNFHETSLISTTAIPAEAELRLVLRVTVDQE